MLPVSTVATRWNVSQGLVYRLFHEGKLRGAKIGGRVMIYPDAVATYEAEQANKPAVKPDRERAVKNPPESRARGFSHCPRPV